MQTYTYLSYSFAKTTKQVTLTGFSGAIEQIKLITDLSTTTPQVIYDPTRNGYGGTLAGSVLTLTYDTNTASFNNSDKLEIIVDPAVTTQPVSIATMPSTPVTGTFWQATQPISGSVTNLANSGVDIGDVTINNASGGSAVNIQDGGNSITVDGTVSVSNSTFPVTDNSGSLTVDAPVATPVFVRLSDGAAAIATLPVSLASVPSHAVTNAGTFAVQSTNQANSGVDIGDVTINNASGASAVNIQDGGNSITVDGTVTSNIGATTTNTVTLQNAATANGNGTNITTDGYSGICIQVTGLGSAIINIEGSNDGGTNWVGIPAMNFSALNSVGSTGFTSNGIYYASCAGVKLMRARISSYSSGTITAIGVVSTIAGPAFVANTNQYYNGTLASTSNGTVNTGTLRVTMASDSTGILAGVTNLSQLGGQAIAMGTGTRSAGTQRVTVATDDLVPTKEKTATTPAQTSPSVTTSSTSILASNTNRLGATIYNEAGSTCLVKLGATASATSYSVQIAVGGYYELPFLYTGAIDGIVASGTATLRVTELT